MLPFAGLVVCEAGTVQAEPCADEMLLLFVIYSLTLWRRIVSNKLLFTSIVVVFRCRGRNKFRVRAITSVNTSKKGHFYDIFSFLKRISQQPEER